MKKYSLLVVVTGLTLSVVIIALIFGFSGSRTTSTSPKEASTPVGPKKDDADTPIVKEARPDTEAILNDLFAGKYDNDGQFAPVARKVKGFQSWSIESQEIDLDNPKEAVHFGGTLKGPAGEATFTVGMVKQQNGKWMIGWFSGPNRK